MRNILAEIFAVEDIKLARIYISTAYAVFAALLIYLFIHSLLDWVFLLNAPENYTSLLNSLVLYVTILFLFQFLLKLITSILNADQRAAIKGALSLVVNFLTLFAVLLLSKVAEPSLTTFALVSSSILVIVFIVALMVMFKKHYSYIAPSFKYIDFNYSSDLVKLGLQFFVNQISSLIVFTSDSIIIIQFYGPDAVVT